MSLSILSRYAFFVGCVLFTLLSLPFLHHEWLWPFTLLTALLSLVGIIDLLQSPHSVRRNYPILGNIRYAVEAIRPEIRQYLLESDSDALPSPVHNARWCIPAPRTNQRTNLSAR